MTARRSLHVTIPLDDDRLAAAVAQSLGVEADGAPPRTSCRVEQRGKTVQLWIEADDTRSLRAGANSFLRWADTAVDIARQARGGESLKRAP